MPLRSPIVAVVGHVDHGKSSVLDYIRNTNIVASEAGAITQAIGASVIPIKTIKEKCGDLAKQLNLQFTIPGLLFIDTPGHAAFSSLRKRGGSLADIAILVVDINEGFQPQTIESIKILQETKTPFVVAANKIDRLQGYRLCSQTGIKSVLGNLSKHPEQFTQHFETKMYTLVQALYEHELPAERFDRVADYTKEVAIVPTSALNGDGMSELLMVVAALTQKYLEKRLEMSAQKNARGTIIEVKEQQGMGSIVDAIVYDGTLNVNDTIVIGDLNEPIVTKVRGLFIPATQKDMRDKKAKFTSVKQVVAATGVRICGPQLERAMSGMPFSTATPDTINAVQESIQKEIQAIRLPTQKEGIIIKADTLGSLEALLSLLADADIPVRLATVGEISKKDVLEAQANADRNPLYGVILGFNIKKPEEVKGIHIFTAPVIYQLIDDFLAWKKKTEADKLSADLSVLPKLGKARYLEGCSFRQSGPAIFGVHVLQGEIGVRMQVMKADGSRLGMIKGLQENKDSVPVAKKDDQVACSIDGIQLERHINEGDVIITSISEQDFLTFKKFKDNLTPEQKELLKEIAQINREQNPVWGIDEETN